MKSVALFTLAYIAPALASPVRSLDKDTSTGSADIIAYLNAHNTVRSKHGAKALVWNSTLATAAQKWANGCVFKHSGGALGPYGENLAAGTGSFPIASAVGSWANESCVWS
jgi:pathogenesis-related protein 1